MSVVKILLIFSILCLNISYASDYRDGFNKSVEFSDSGKFKEAIETLRQIKDYKGNEKTYHYQLGTLLCQLKKFSSCIKELREALKVDPNDKRINRNLEIAYFENQKKSGNKKRPQEEKKKKKKRKKQNSKKKMDKFNKRFNKQIKSHKYVERNIFKKRLMKRLANPNQNFKKDW